MPYFNFKQQQVYYVHSPGSHGKPTLLWLHGAGGSQAVWPEQLKHMPGVSTYALDLPGHGLSSGPGRDKINGYADVAQAFLDALNLFNVVVAGHSMGGAIALTLALRRLPQLAGLVLIGTGARLRVAPAILDNLVQDFEATVDAIMQSAWSPGADAGWVALSRQIMLETGPDVLHGDYVACNNFDVMTQLNQIQAPALVLTGAADRLTPLKYGQYLATNIPQARLAAFDGGGHFLAQEQPQQVAAEITTFLTTLPVSGG